MSETALREASTIYHPAEEDKKRFFSTEYSTTKLKVLLLSCTSTPATTKSLIRRTRNSTSMWTLQQIQEFIKNTYDDVTSIVLPLQDVEFNPCEGNYSKAKNECSWPCQITLRDPNDHLNVVYYALVDWADVVIVATPIRYGQPSALYYKLVERLTCIHNQLTLNDYNLIIDKVAAFIITGGQDNIQAVAGSMLLFWSEIGFTFAGHAYVGWSRGWNREDMESNYDEMIKNQGFKMDLFRLVNDAIEMKRRLNQAKLLLKRPVPSSYSEYEVSRHLKIDGFMKKHEICKITDIESGHQKMFEVQGKHILVANMGGSFYTVDGICTHARVQFDDGKLENNKNVVCLAHGAAFDVKSGKLERFNSKLYGCYLNNLNTYKTSVESGKVFVEF